jgi:WD40 repeat protein
MSAEIRSAAAGSSVDGSVPPEGLYDAFICYRRIPADERFVDHLCQALAARDQPKTIWVDRKRIEPAAKWQDRVTRAIEASRAVIYVMTPESVASEDCRRELDLAAERNRLIIPIRLRDVPPTAAVHPQVAAANWILADPEGVPGGLVDEVVRALEDDLDWRDRHTYLGTRAAQWHSQNGKRKRGFLLRREELQDAEAWLRQAARHPKEVSPTPLHQDYIKAGRKAENRSRNRVIVGLSLGLAVSLTATAVALVQRQDAQNSARIATARQDAAESSADLSGDAQQSLGLALAGMKLNAGAPEVQALRLALAQDRLRMTIKTGTGASTQADWNGALAQVAVTAPHDSVALWDTATGKLIQTLPTGHAVSQILYNSSGSRLAAVSSAGYVSMWRISVTGRATSIDTRPLNNEISSETPSADRSTFGSLIIGSWTDDDDGQFDVAGAGLTDIIGYNPSTGSVRNVVDAQGLFAWESIPSPSGTQWFLGGAEDNLLNPATGQLTPISTGLASGGGACWLADGSAVFTTSNTGISGTEALYSDSGSVIAQLPQAQPTTAVACSASPANRWVAAGDETGDLYLRLAGGRVMSLYGDDDEITSMASSPDGGYLATASDDGTARIWNATTGQLVTALTGDGAPLLGVQFGAGDGLVLTVDKSGFVRIWDTDLGEPVVTLQEPAHEQAIPYGFAANGALITGAGLVTSSGAEAQVTQASALTWNARTGRLLRQVPLPGIVDAPVPCSSLLESWARGLAAEMLPASNCSLPPPPDLDVEAVMSRPLDTSDSYGHVMELLPMAAAPDGRYEAYARRDEVVVLGADGQQVAHLRLDATPDGLSFYDGDTSVMVMTADDIYLWRPLSGQSPLVVPQPGQPTDATVSDGLLAAADGGERVGVWSASTGKLIRTFTPSPSKDDGLVTPAVPLRVALTGDGAMVAAGSDDGSVSLWDITTGRLIARDASDGYVVELTGAAGDLLAVDWPAIGAHGPFSPVNGEVIVGSTGQVAATYTANNQVQPSVNPGAALSPDAGFILAGTDGIAPAPPGGANAAYQVSSGQTMTGLQSVTQSALYSYADSPASPWSPDGTEVLIGTAVYACDACGDSTALENAAGSRLDWAEPLSASADHPPSSSPYA